VFSTRWEKVVSSEATTTRSTVTCWLSMRPGRIGGLIYGQRSYVPTPDKKHRVAVTRALRQMELPPQSQRRRTLTFASTPAALYPAAHDIDHRSLVGMTALWATFTRPDRHALSRKMRLSRGAGGAAGLDQRLNLAINAGLADPRLKARLDEIGLFDERDVRRGGQDSSLAGACLRQSGSVQPTTRFSICLGVRLRRCSPVSVMVASPAISASDLG